MDFYYMHAVENKIHGVANAPEDTDLFVLPEEGEVKNWQPIPMVLQDGTFSDYQANNLGCRLFSKHLKEVLDNEKSSDDLLQWLSVSVSNNTGDKRDYFILHFVHGSDILNEKKSIFAGSEMVVKPVLAKKKTAKHKIVTFKGAGQETFFIAESVKDTIEKAECIGMEFSKVAAD